VKATARQNQLALERNLLSLVWEAMLCKCIYKAAILVAGGIVIGFTLSEVLARSLVSLEKDVGRLSNEPHFSHHAAKENEGIIDLLK